MRKLALGLLVCWAATQVYAGEWLTDVPKAMAKAKAEKKRVLLDFTGSDWCPPCKALHATVYTSKEFADYADKNLVLVEIDFPRTKQLPEALKKANDALAKKYAIKGYPTTIVLDADGKELVNIVGYSRETPSEFIAKLEKSAAKAK